MQKTIVVNGQDPLGNKLLSKVPVATQFTPGTVLVNVERSLPPAADPAPCRVNSDAVTSIIVNQLYPVGTLLFSPLPADSPAVNTGIWMLCNGAQLSTATYSYLYQFLGRSYTPAGTSTTLFNIPDYRGQFLRGLGGDSAALGVKQADAIREIKGGLSDYGITGETHAGSLSGDGNLFKNSTISLIGKNGTGTNGHTSVAVDMRVSGVVPTAVENRPTNYAVNIYIKYADSDW